MAMQKMKPAESPDAYVAALGGWRRELVESLRDAVRSAGTFDEMIKWGHLVYLDHGPALLIRAEEERVLFGFWRGQRLRGIEPMLKPGGKYEMASIELREGMGLAPAVAKKLAKAAAALNRQLGDPAALVPSRGGAKNATAKKATTRKAASLGTATATRARKAATQKAAARKPPLSPSGSARKRPR
jgi:hypothetical protein